LFKGVRWKGRAKGETVIQGRAIKTGGDLPVSFRNGILKRGPGGKNPWNDGRWERQGYWWGVLGDWGGRGVHWVCRGGKPCNFVKHSVSKRGASLSRPPMGRQRGVGGGGHFTAVKIYRQMGGEQLAAKDGDSTCVGEALGKRGKSGKRASPSHGGLARSENQLHVHSSCHSPSKMGGGLNKTAAPTKMAVGVRND